MSEIPFLLEGSDELGAQVGKTAECPSCGLKHKVEWGKTEDKRGMLVESRTLGAVQCKGTDYIVAFNDMALQVKKKKGAK